MLQKKVQLLLLIILPLLAVTSLCVIGWYIQNQRDRAERERIRAEAPRRMMEFLRAVNESPKNFGPGP